MTHEGQRLIVTNAKYAGGPAPGEAGWVDEDYAERLVARGSARYADRLSERSKDAAVYAAKQEAMAAKAADSTAGMAKSVEDHKATLKDPVTVKIRAEDEEWEALLADEASGDL